MIFVMGLPLSFLLQNSSPRGTRPAHLLFAHRVSKESEQTCPTEKNSFVETHHLRYHIVVNSPKGWIKTYKNDSSLGWPFPHKPTNHHFLLWDIFLNATKWHPERKPLREGASWRKEGDRLHSLIYISIIYISVCINI